jgi:methionyl-tRNA formyltransferase
MTAMSDDRIVLLGGDHRSTRIVCRALRAHFTLAAAIIENEIPRGQLITRRIQRLGWPTVLGQLAFQTLVSPVLARQGRARVREILAEHQLADTPFDPDILRRVPSVNAEATTALLRDLRPKVVVVNGTRIIARRVLECVPATFINTHAGITPLYRGVHGGYWALANGDPEHCGVTVHVVDPGIDTGAIIAQARISPTPRDTFATYTTLQLAAGIPLLIAAIRAALDDHLTQTPAPAGESRLWYHPTLGQYLRRRLGQGVR